MPIEHHRRQRLATLMDTRRAELRYRWTDLAALSGISYEAIRAIRNGTGDIRLLTQRALETALQWEYGSIQAILDGRPPTPARTAMPDELPPLTADERRLVIAFVQGIRETTCSGEPGRRTA